MKYILLCFTDYAEELRFYLIHMTEVRDLCNRVCVCVCALDVKEKRQKRKGNQGLM